MKITYRLLFPKAVIWLLLSWAAAMLLACGGNYSPQASFVIKGNGSNAPATLMFDASSSTDSDGTIVSYVWDFGDGNGANGELTEHEYQIAGDYLVKLTVTDNRGGQHTFVLPVHLEFVPKAPTAALTVSVLRGVAPLVVEFGSDNSFDPDGEIVEYVWHFENGERRTGSFIDYTFQQPGTFHVELEVFDSDGLSDIDTVDITVIPPDSRFSVQGQIGSLAYTDVDGDVNDPNGAYFDNNAATLDDIQPLSNPVLLNGFVSEYPSSRSGDAFAFEADLQDFYSVDLRAGDYISLRVINFENADIDLLLLDANTLDVIVSSTTQNEFESVQIPAPGKYFIMVNAMKGASKYLLKVGESSMLSGILGDGTLVNTAMIKGQSANFAPDQLMIKTKRGATSASTPKKAQLEQSHSSHNRVALARINSLNPQTRMVLQLQANETAFDSLLEGMNPNAAAKIRTLKTIKRLSNAADVELAEPNYAVEPFLIPSDPAYILQWHYPAINLPQAWDITTGSNDIVVAVVDSGVYFAHPDLAGRLTQGYDFISDVEAANDGDGIDPDANDPGDSISIGGSSWHGTHVSGTIAALMDNDEGGVGVAPGVRVMPLRAIGRGGGLTYDVLQAVRYAAGLENDSGLLPQKPADIINLSLGGSGFSRIAQSLYTEVRNKGIVVVAASGNDSSGEAMYPASYDGVISVAGTDFLGQRAPYSNYGPYVDIAAPGGRMSADRNNDGYADGILSAAVKIGDAGQEPGYVFYQGTSMAAPHVSGVIALMKSVYPELSPDELDSLIVSGTITSERGVLGRDNEFGYGIIDAFLAVSAAQALASGGETAAIVSASNILAFDSFTDRAVINLKAVGNGTIRISGYAPSEPWISIAALDIDERALGLYEIFVRRENLEDGNYHGFVEFVADTGQVVKIQVNLRVGELVDTGDAGFLYVFLVKASSYTVVDVLDVGSIDGQYNYRFDNVPVGDYYIAAGSDIDNDGLVCVIGESCGFFPSISKAGKIEMTQDKSNVNFPVGLFNAIAPDLTSSGTQRVELRSLRRSP